MVIQTTVKHKARALTLIRSICKVIQTQKKKGYPKALLHVKGRYQWAVTTKKKIPK